MAPESGAAYWGGGLSLPQLYRRAAVEQRGNPAAVCGGRERSFEALIDRAQRLANGLAGLGLTPGDRVAILLPNCLEYPEIDVGLSLAGLVRVGLNVRLGVEDFSFMLEDCQPRALISDETGDEVAAELAERFGVEWIRLGEGAGPDPARDYERLLESSSQRVVEVPRDPSAASWIVYTSGTSGRPKGIVLSERAVSSVAFNLMLDFGPIRPGKSILLPQPLSHGAGYFSVANLIAGAAMYITPRFDPEEAVAMGRRHGIATFKCVPTMLCDMLDVADEIPFESVIYGAAPLALPKLEEAVDRYGPVLQQLYGQSEAPMTITVLQKEDHARPGSHRASAGRACRAVAVDVVDPEGSPMEPGEIGEIVVSGSHLMDGYLGLPELTAEVLRDGWLWTRDMGFRDEEGYVYLRGRADEMIISGGFNVAPKEVEDVVLLHPEVRACAVVGVPDDRLGETVQVHVVPVDGSAVDADSIVDFCKPTLGFRRPRSVVFTDSLPASAYGKIDRAALRASGAAEGAASEETA
jgi:acyl-CoA synthetase (AMP-forming)/AMP-acid ligase II